MRILISGATGLVGSALSRVLQAADWEVHALRRWPHPERQQTGDMVWSPLTGEIETDRLDGLDAVVHLAGENVAAGRWTRTRRAAIRDSRIDGTRFLSRALARCTRPPAVLVCASAVGYYGDSGEAWLDEVSPPGSDFLARVAVAWENAADAARDAGIRVVHLRFGVILSASGGALARMLPIFRLGLGGRLGHGRQYMSWLSLPEAVSMIRFAISQAQLAGPVNAVAPEPVTNAFFTRTLARVLSRPAVLPLPAWAARAALGEMADALLLSGTRVRPTRLMESGYNFLHPDLETALKALLGETS
ncbi:MAG: TIGR01777 family protein [Acidobacteria bacterium]|nr:MAG: TIGR01777 family protein [Acidobacteriota bacterium]